jgi:hypothetical protein
MPEPQSPAFERLAIDSHVHVHDITDPQAWLDTILWNFKKSTGELQNIGPFQGALILTEPKSHETFSLLRRYLDTKSPTAGPWDLAATAEPISLTASNKTGDTILLFSGQQIVTLEKLEVLSLLALPKVADGLTLTETILQIQRIGGLPVLPWGVGKWLGRRGDVVNEALANHPAGAIFLGDNGGRPSFWQAIPQFQRAREAGIPILRGSDPLRCSFRRRGPGSFGNTINCRIDTPEPGKSLKDALAQLQSSPPEFGNLELPWYFIKDQIALRVS